MTETGSRPGPAERPTEHLTFEQARDLLSEVVERLQQGQGTLEESLDLWERGEQLAKVCEDYLDAARVRIERVISAHSEPVEDPTDSSS